MGAGRPATEEEAPGAASASTPAASASTRAPPASDQAQARPARDRVDPEEGVAGEDRPQVIIYATGETEEQVIDQTDVRNAALAVTWRQQLNGDPLSFVRWQRHDGHVTVEVMDGPGRPPRWTAQQSGDSLIALLDAREMRLADGAGVTLEAIWNTELPRVTEFTARFPGPISEATARELVESPVAGLAISNDWPRDPLLRLISTGRFEDGSGDTLVRFQTGEEVARAIQRTRGVVSFGPVQTTLWWNMAAITPATVITFNLQH